MEAGLAWRSRCHTPPSTRPKRAAGSFRSTFPSFDRGAAFKAQIIPTLCVGGMVARTTDDAVLRRSLRATLTQALQLFESRADRSVRRRPRRNSGATIPRRKTQEATV